MQKQGWGRIVNISSIHGKEASPFKSACASQYFPPLFALHHNSLF
jgi:NAD(P)-dependent dehydrogenase (short-subunit alcohol dehydrogenase family)